MQNLERFFSTLCVIYNKESFLFFFSGENANKLEFKEPAVLLDKKVSLFFLNTTWSR